MLSTQPYHDPSFLEEVWGLYGLGVFVILLRLFVRIRTVGVRAWQGDDYMAIAVLACYTVDAVTVMLCYQYGTNVDFTAEQLAAFNPQQKAWVTFGSKMQLLAWYTYTGLVWGLKAMMLFLFNRLTFGLKQQQFIKVLAISVFVTYIAVFLTITLGCYPTSKNWQVDPPPSLKCAFKPQNFYVSTVLNVITDAALLAIPLPLMWTLQVPLKKKIALCLLLCSGVFVISAAIIRIVMTLVAHPSALTINRWGVRETIAGIIAVNVAIIRPIFLKEFWTKGPISSTGSNKHSHNSRATGTTTSRRGQIASQMWGKVEAFEMTDTSIPRDLHTEEKHVGTPENVVELDSNSDIQQSTYCSSEDLVLQRNSTPPSEHRDPTDGRRTSDTKPSRRSSEAVPDLERGETASSSSSGRVQVRVDHFVQSSRSPSGRAMSPVEEWENETTWNNGWQNRGYGNRVTIEGGERGDKR